MLTYMDLLVGYVQMFLNENQAQTNTHKSVISLIKHVNNANLFCLKMVISTTYMDLLASFVKMFLNENKA